MTLEADTGHAFRGSRLLRALGFGARREACAPPGARVYAVGDLHGCAGALDEMHARIAKDAAAFRGEKHIVYLGDYIDRGPDARGVVERLIEAVPEGFSPHYLRGNHEAALLEFLGSADAYRAWRSFGAPETLLSYGVRPPLYDSAEMFEEARKALAAAIPPTHGAFFRALEPMVILGDYVFVHAGVRPGLSLEEQTDQDLLWIRDDFLSCANPHEKVVVHGHTPAPRPVRLHNRIGLDTGVYATGILTCAVLEGTDCRFMQAGAGRRNG